MAKPRFGLLQHREISPLIENSTNFPASDEFVRKVNEGVASLPDFICRLWLNAGGSISTGRFLSDIFPQLKEGTPGGWDKNKNWDNSDAVCIDDQVGLAEYTWFLRQPKGTSLFSKAWEADIQMPWASYAEPPQYKEGPDGIKQRLGKVHTPQRTVRHEAGHALDYGFGRQNKLLSQTREFERAYAKDIENLNDDEREIWYYQIQPDKNGKPTLGGRKEAFAEAFAALYGGGNNKPELVAKYFGNTQRFIKKTIRKKHGFFLKDQVQAKLYTLATYRHLGSA